LISVMLYIAAVSVTLPATGRQSGFSRWPV
jgi:hypothetical protein